MPARFIATVPPLFVLVLAAACSRDEPAPAPDVTEPASASASAEAKVEAKVNVEPRLGGSVFLAGESQLELAVSADGRVDGLVYDAAGNAIPPARVTEFAVTLAAEGAAKPRVNLQWDASAQRFHGQADAGANLVAKPVDVTLQIDGKAQAGVLRAYTLLPASVAAPKLEANADATVTTPPANVRGKLAADAKARADMKPPKLTAPNGAASLQSKASAKLAVPQPKAGVSAKASAASDTKKTRAGVKAKASFGFGN